MRNNNDDSSDELFKGAWESGAIDAVTTRRKELVASQEYVVDQIFPAGAMHLIGGPSGVGKTSWLLQTLYEWEQGHKLFGEFKSRPCPWVLINCDRSLREMNQTLIRLGLGHWEFESYALEDLIYDPATKRCKSPDFTIDILQRFKYAKLIVVEGLQAVMPDNSKTRSQNKQELLWALEQRYVLAQGNRTVIATTHNPKVAAMGAPANDERSKFLGSQGFIGSCSTMIGFEKHPKIDYMRSVTVMGRNFADIKLQYSSTKENQGRFVLESIGDNAVATDEDNETFLALWATSQPGAFTITDAVTYCMRNDIELSESSVERWLRNEAQSPEGKLERFRVGKRYSYRKRSLDVADGPEVAEG
jgi:hypothetical protein